MSFETAPGTEMRFFQPDRDYRQFDSVSQSELKEVLKSPAHWLARYGPDALPSYPSAAMIIGTATHCDLLEPERFPKTFCDRSQRPPEPTVPELRQAAKEQGIKVPTGAKKADIEKLIYPDGREVDKRTPLSADDFSTVTGMAEALRTHDVAGAWFDPSRENYRRANEVSLYVTAEAHPEGMPIKGRIDRLEKTDDGWLILDLKTTDDASPDVFQRKAFNLGYFLQAAFYIDLVALVTGCDREQVDFMFCAVERKKPHCVKLYEADRDAVSWGRDQYTKALRTLKICKEMGDFYGYAPQPQRLRLPAWVKTGQVDQELF